MIYKIKVIPPTRSRRRDAESFLLPRRGLRDRLLDTLSFFMANMCGLLHQTKKYIKIFRVVKIKTQM